MSPTLELQGAIVARLKATGAVTALVGSRIYDPVPEGATFPYVSMGPADEIQIDADCVDAVEVTFILDAWSRESGFVQVSRIADAVRDALHKYVPTLSINALVEINHAITRRFRDPDGKTSHAVMEFTATIETA
jgi:hypothetical protein